ncbi:MAG: YhdH/YhfP family quinone oxidoreductase [Pseudomonadales bacterium]|nr:YhdH/YhfP family quinone oxidoreductase [Pseudomonadales bacterium]
MTTFRAFWVEKTESEVSHQIVERSIDDLPEGEVLIRVAFSSVNYKDAMSATGLPGVTKHYPHTPGIDAAGTVVNSTSSDVSAGDEVICVGFDLGMNTPGGYGEYIRVPAKWVTKKPAGLSLRDSMVIGTAGLTAALCVDKLQRMGAAPADGPVLVTGATGGVGSIAVCLLATLGYETIALSGKNDQAALLKSLGADLVIPRVALAESDKRPMLAPEYAHAIDCVGGEILTNVIKRLSPQGSVAICGLVASPVFSATVLPFILRGVNVLGIDSVEIPISLKSQIWQRLADQWQLTKLPLLTSEIQLDGLSAAFEDILAGRVSGRILVRHDPA